MRHGQHSYAITICLLLHMADVARLSRKVGSKILANQTADERIDCLLPFADCINEHLEIGLIQAWDVKGFENLDKQLRWALGSPDDPYYSALARAVSELVDYVKEEDRISLICDDDTETAWECYRHYRGLQNASPEIRKKLVSLTFASDQTFPALQAADMVAYLSRLEARSRFYQDRYSFRRLFEYLTKVQPIGKMEWYAMFADEALLRNMTLKAKPNTAKRKKVHK
jgi:hypothetical protein